MGRPARLLLEIFDAVVSKPWPEECIIFSGKQQPNGYGRVSVDGQYVRAHRFACEIAHGDAPPDRPHTAHSCGERMCINPRHLRWATRAENEADKIAHGRSNRGDQRSATVRLRADDVRDIRRRYGTTGVTQQALADEYGVHIMTINSIIHHRTWRHI